MERDDEGHGDVEHGDDKHISSGTKQADHRREPSVWFNNVETRPGSRPAHLRGSGAVGVGVGARQEGLAAAIAVDP